MTADGPGPSDPQSAFADEGESHANLPVAPPAATLNFPSAENPWSFRRRMSKAWRILRGRDIAERVTADPESRLRQARAHQENRWRSVYAFVLLVGMLGQVIFADVFFWQYTVHNEFRPPEGVVIAFLTSVVVEVIGLVLVVTQSLFPRSRDSATSPSAAP